MKIVGICGSPRHNGNSEWALNCILNECSKFSNIEQINVSEKNICFCDGCLICEDNLPCHIDDCMSEINECLKTSDIIIISTPVYFDNIPSILKNLIDRTNPICNSLKGKKALVVTFGQADKTSWDNATQYLKTYFDILGVSTLGVYSFEARNMHDAERSVSVKKQLHEIVLDLEKNIKYGNK